MSDKDVYLEVDRNLVTWLAGGERGISSNAIVKRLTGLSTSTTNWFVDHPHDGADFMRCEKLLREVPSLRPHIGRMDDVSPVWARFVNRWDEIGALLETEIPGVFDGARGMAPRTYALIRSIIGEGDATL